MPERLVLDGVPADAEAEAEAPAREHVDLGRLLREQRRLPLGQDDDAGTSSRAGRDAGEVAEQHEDSWNMCSARYGPSRRGARVVGAQHVVVGEEVVVAELLHGLRVLADATGSAPISVCGKTTPSFMRYERRSTRDPPTMASRPSAKRSQALPLPS